MNAPSYPLSVPSRSGPPHLHATRRNPLSHRYGSASTRLSRSCPDIRGRSGFRGVQRSQIACADYALAAPPLKRVCWAPVRSLRIAKDPRTPCAPTSRDSRPGTLTPSGDKRPPRTGDRRPPRSHQRDSDRGTHSGGTWPGGPRESALALSATPPRRGEAPCRTMRGGGPAGARSPAGAGAGARRRPPLGRFPSQSRAASWRSPTPSPAGDWPSWGRFAAVMGGR